MSTMHVFLEIWKILEQSKEVWQHCLGRNKTDFVQTLALKKYVIYFSRYHLVRPMNSNFSISNIFSLESDVCIIISFCLII